MPLSQLNPAAAFANLNRLGQQFSANVEAYLVNESEQFVSQAKFASLAHHLTRLHQDIQQAEIRLDELAAKLVAQEVKNN